MKTTTKNNNSLKNITKVFKKENLIDAINEIQTFLFTLAIYFQLRLCVIEDSACQFGLPGSPFFMVPNQTNKQKHDNKSSLHIGDRQCQEQVGDAVSVPPRIGVSFVFAHGLVSMLLGYNPQR